MLPPEFYKNKKRRNPLTPDEKTKSYRRARAFSDSVPINDMPCAVPPEIWSWHKPEKYNENEEKHSEIHRAVCDFFEGDTIQLTRRKFPDEEKAALISHLNKSGMNLTNEQFHEVLTIARSVNRKKQTEKEIPFGYRARQVALNNYDYDELKKEYCSLVEKIGADEIRQLCPTLCQIIEETENTEDKEYPGRHLPIEYIEGRTAWRYQCLRIMDRKLFTATCAVTNEEMERHIFSEFNRLGIRVPNSMLDKYQIDGPGVLKEVLKRNYAILSELIFPDVRKKYGRNAYRGGGVRGHIYRAANADDPYSARVTAFKTMLTLDEAIWLSRELNSLRRLHFSGRNSDLGDSYPLLSLLSVLDRISKTPQAFRNRVCKANYTDLLTIDYRPDRLQKIKGNILRAISNKKIISVKVDNRRESYYPLAIRDEGPNWALVALDVISKKISLLQPEQLASSMLVDDARVPDYEEVDYNSHIVGLSDLDNKDIKDVIIDVTEIAYNEITRRYSASRLARLRPTLIEKVRMPNYKRFRYCYRLGMRVYLNNDFFEELLNLDRRACLVNIEPEEILTLYKSFFKTRNKGREWIPLLERKGTGRLRLKNE